MGDSEGAVSGFFNKSNLAPVQYNILGPGPGGAMLREVHLWSSQNVSTTGVVSYGLVLTSSPAETAENYAAGAPLIGRTNSYDVFPRGEVRMYVRSNIPREMKWFCQVHAPLGAWYLLLGTFMANVLVFTTISVRYTLRERVSRMADPGNVGDFDSVPS